MTTVPPPRSPGDVLRLAREKIDTPEKWTQNDVARDSEGRPLGDSTDPRAVCWCIQGAIWSLRADSRVEYYASQFVVQATGEKTVVGFNDQKGRTHAEILAAFDRAISLADKGVMP